MKTENYILNLSEFIPHWFEDVHKAVDSACLVQLN